MRARASLNPCIRIALVQPNKSMTGIAEIPLSIVGLAAILQQAGVEVVIIDARLRNLSPAQAMRDIRNGGFDAVGITGMNSEYRFIKDFCFMLKRKFPDMPLMAGGAFISSIPEAIMARLPIDVACTGDGEDVIVELTHRLAHKESLEGLNNIAYWENGKLVRSEIVPIQDLDRYPIPAYELLDMAAYAKTLGHETFAMRYFMITTGLGCPNHCYYCGRPSVKLRRPSPEKVLEIMDHLHERYAINAFCFAEDSPFSARQWILDFCDLVIRSGRRYSFLMTGCPNQFDAEILEAVKKAGIRQIGTAVEHFNPEIQRGFYRIKQSEDIFKAFQLFKEHDIPYTGFNILWGHPKDSAISIRDAYKKGVEVVKDYDIGVFYIVGLYVIQNSRFAADALKSGKINDYEDYLCAFDGFGPYINLTEENDDTYRGVIKLIRMRQELFILWRGMRKILSHEGWPYSYQRSKAFARTLMRIFSKIYKYAQLSTLLALPKNLRNFFRNRLEDLLMIAMYDNTAGYYRSLQCHEEILALPKGARIAVFGSTAHLEKAFPKILNSVRERSLELIGFLVENGSGNVNGIPVHTVDDICSIELDYLVILNDSEPCRPKSVMQRLRFKQIIDLMPMQKNSNHENVKSRDYLVATCYNPKLTDVDLDADGNWNPVIHSG